MPQFSLRHWLKRMATHRTHRRRTDSSKWQRTRPSVEILEGRWVPSTVTNLNDAGVGSLRQAILDTPAGGTVDFQAGLTGTITLASGELLISRNLTIVGPGANALTISGNHASRVFDIPATSTVMISGLAIADGQAPNYQEGGGIYNAGTLTVSGSTIINSYAFYNSQGAGGGISNIGILVITGSTFTGNYAAAGGAIANSANGTVAVTHSTLTDNHALGFNGGAIASYGNALSVTDCTISGNSGGGGGIGIGSGTVTIASSTLRDNAGGGILNGGTLTVIGSIVSHNSGGGINNQGTLIVTDSTLSDNTAGAGAGITNVGGTVTIARSILSGNSAGGDGGGIFYIGIRGSSLSITDSTFSGNSAGFGGGGIFSTGTLTVTNSTFHGNFSGQFGSGGGIFNGGTLTIANATFSGNASPVGGGGIANSGAGSLQDTIVAGNTAPLGPDVSGSVHSQGHNLIGNGTDGSGFDPTDLVGTGDQPIDPLLGPLQDNGGPTPTMALLPDSPAIDAGDNAGAPTWDQRGPGFPRIVNGIIDIGAFEVQAVAPTITCAMAQSLLWPPNHRLVNVGLSVTVDPPDADLQVQVYANDHARSSDAQDIAPDTLRLRAERQGNGTGRVYLIVVTAANAGGSSFDVCTVAVPHDHSPRSIDSVQQQAAAAGAYYREFQTAPPEYSLLGEGPDRGRAALAADKPAQDRLTGNIFSIAPAALSSLPTSANLTAPRAVVDARTPAESLLTAWRALPIDTDSATAHTEAARFLVPLPEPAWLEDESWIDIFGGSETAGCASR